MITSGRNSIISLISEDVSVATDAAAATVELLEQGDQRVAERCHGASEGLRQNDLGGGLHEAQAQRSCGLGLANRHGVDARTQRFAHERRRVQAQTGDREPEEVRGEGVGEAELQLRVGTQHHEHHDDGQRQVLEQFHIRTGHGPERGNRRDAHHHKDHAEDQGEQGGP